MPSGGGGGGKASSEGYCVSLLRTQLEMPKIREMGNRLVGVGD